MSKSYGIMMGYDKAIEWVEAMEVAEDQEQNKARVLARMRCERDKTIPVKANRQRSKSIGDIITCGNCGADLDFLDEYCWKCGFRIKLG